MCKASQRKLMPPLHAVHGKLHGIAMNRKNMASHAGFGCGQVVFCFRSIRAEFSRHPALASRLAVVPFSC